MGLQRIDPLLFEKVLDNTFVGRSFGKLAMEAPLQTPSIKSQLPLTAQR
jgi:hypothetical protein